MSKVLEIREICGDYAIDIEYSKDYTFTMFFNSRRNAETVKRCIEVDDSVPNVATAVDFVEVVRCKDCKYRTLTEEGEYNPEDIVCVYFMTDGMQANDYCSYGERSENGTAEYNK
jgi:hypothetical protein